MSILLIAALSLGQVSFRSDYPLQDDYYMPQLPGVFNTTAIVEPVRRLGPFLRTVTQGETSFKRTVLVDELKVLDSQPAIKGMLRVVVPFGRELGDVDIRAKDLLQSRYDHSPRVERLLPLPVFEPGRFG